MKFTLYFVQLAVAILLLAVSRQATSELYIIAYNQDWAPFSYIDSEGNVQGILLRLMEELARESSIAELKAVGLPWDRVSHAVRHGAASAFITFASREQLGFSETIGPTIYELGQTPWYDLKHHWTKGRYFKWRGCDTVRWLETTGAPLFTGRWALNLLQLGIRERASILSIVIVRTCSSTNPPLSPSEWRR